VFAHGDYGQTQINELEKSNATHGDSPFDLFILATHMPKEGRHGTTVAFCPTRRIHLILCREPLGFPEFNPVFQSSLFRRRLIWGPVRIRGADKSGHIQNAGSDAARRRPIDSRQEFAFDVGRLLT
jgi:hypothetical protein